MTQTKQNTSAVQDIKIAYIGYDQSAFLAYPGLSDTTEQVQFFLIHPEQNNNFTDFDSIDIFVNHVMIPANTTERTAEHSRQFAKVKENYQELHRWICSFKFADETAETKKEKLITTESNLKDNIINASQIVDIRSDERQKKCFIEIKQKGLKEFDFIIIEDHDLVLQFFQGKNINYFNKMSSQSRTWVGYKYKMTNLSSPEAFKKPMDCFAVDESGMDSIVDNFSLVHLSQHELIVWQWLPTYQIDNPQFDRFILDRIQILVAKKFPFLNLKAEEPIKIKTTVNCEHKPKKYLDSTFLSVPNFSFWKSKTVADYLKKRINRKVMDYLKEVDRKKREAERLKAKSDRELNS